MGAVMPTSSAIRPIIAVDALVLSYSVLTPMLLKISFKDLLPRKGLSLINLESAMVSGISKPASFNTLRTPVSPKPRSKLRASTGNPKVFKIPLFAPAAPDSAYIKAFSGIVS